VLNAFAYTGAMGVAAALGGADQCVNLDTSAAALALAERNRALNGLPTEAFEVQEADVFSALRRFRDVGRGFDLIILDPPKFAQSAAQLGRASRAYKDINLLALKLLRPEGLLVTFSCSGAVSAELFQQVVQGAALDAGRPAQIVGRLTQAADHPVLLTFPEADYLKGLIVRVQ
jgi:23S rRNA (cytosine1962-C5)-methyltransferase